MLTQPSLSADGSMVAFASGGDVIATKALLRTCLLKVLLQAGLDRARQQLSKLSGRALG